MANILFATYVFCLPLYNSWTFSRLDQERRRQEEMERQLQRQRELEQEREEQRKAQLEQREAARREMERQRQQEWEKQRSQELQQARQREQEKVLSLKAHNQKLGIDLSQLVCILNWSKSNLLF